MKKIVMTYMVSLLEDLDFRNDQYLRPRDLMIVTRAGGI